MPHKDNVMGYPRKNTETWVDWKVRPAITEDASTIVKLAQEVKDFILPYALSEVSIRNYIERWVVVYDPKTQDIGGAEHSTPNMNLRPADLGFLRYICQMDHEEMVEFQKSPSKVLKAQPICPGKGTLKALIDWQKENYDEVWIWLSLNSTIREFCIKNGLVFDGQVYNFLNVWKADISHFSVGKWKKPKERFQGMKKSFALEYSRDQKLKAEAENEVKKLYPKLSGLKPGDYIVIKGPLGSGKTLVANLIKEVFTGAPGLKFEILDTFNIPRGFNSRHQVRDWFGSSIITPLKNLNSIGILVYQTLGQWEHAIEVDSRGVIIPTLNNDRASIHLDYKETPHRNTAIKDNFSLAYGTKWDLRPIESTPEEAEERLLQFNLAMKEKWGKGSKKYGPVFQTNPFEEAMQECLDLALYAKVIYFRVKELKERTGQ